MEQDSDALIRATLETSGHRDNADIGRRLDRWLQGRWGKGASVLEVGLPGSSGASSEVFFVRIANAPFAAGEAVTDAVIRLAPSYAVYPVVDLGLQFRCMRAASLHSPAPVPKVFAYEADAEALGAPFILMQRGQGRGGTGLAVLRTRRLD